MTPNISNIKMWIAEADQKRTECPESETEYWRGVADGLRRLLRNADMQITVLKRARQLLSLLTIRQVIEGGNDAIDAAGINPWCMNEGQANGDENLDLWWIDAVVNNTETD